MTCTCGFVTLYAYLSNMSYQASSVAVTAIELSKTLVIISCRTSTVRSAVAHAHSLDASLAALASLKAPLLAPSGFALAPICCWLLGRRHRHLDCGHFRCEWRSSLGTCTPPSCNPLLGDPLDVLCRFCTVQCPATRQQHMNMLAAACQLLEVVQNLWHMLGLGAGLSFA